jgi:hypothetical protein
MKTTREVNTSEPTYGFNMRSADSASSTRAGIDADANGHLLTMDRYGNTRNPSGLAGVLAGPGTAHTNTTDETVLASVTIPANSIRNGGVVRVSFMAICTATNSTDTATIRLRIGGTTLTGTAVLTGAAVDVANSSFVTGYFELHCRETPNSAASCVGWGWLSNFGTSSTGVAPVPQALAATDFATDAAILVEVTNDWSVASGSNSARAESLAVWID